MKNKIKQLAISDFIGAGLSTGSIIGTVIGILTKNPGAGLIFGISIGAFAGYIASKLFIS